MLRPALIGLLALSGSMMVAAWLISLHIRQAHPDVPVYAYLIEGTVNGPVLILLGALLAIRRPDHPVTWVFCALVLSGSAQQVSGAYAHEALLAARAGLPGGYPALFVSNISQSWFVVFALLLITLFPTGRSVSPPWQTVAWALVLGGLGSLIHPLVRERPFADDPLFGHVEGLLAGAIPDQVATAVGLVTAGAFVYGILGTLAQVVLRFRRSHGAERQQLKWFAYAVVVGVVLLIVPLPGRDRLPDWLLWTLVPLAIWTAMAVAILRYRLYDIDLVINRTLVYGALTGFLGLVYVGSVLGLSQLVPGEDNDPAVAAATLAVAALFAPARRRIQAFVDRRFYRSRYDARRTLEAFGSRLREEVELETLLADLQVVVRDTLHPSSVGVWVRRENG